VFSNANPKQQNTAVTQILETKGINKSAKRGGKKTLSFYLKFKVEGGPGFFPLNRRIYCLFITIKRQALDEVDVERQATHCGLCVIHLNYTGTKIWCGVARGGACTMHVDGVAMRTACLTVGRRRAKTSRTIEGLDQRRKSRRAQAWVSLAVPQCGTAQSVK